MTFIDPDKKPKRMPSQLTILKRENRELRDEVARLKNDILAVTKRCDKLHHAAACWSEVRRRFLPGLVKDIERAATGTKG